MPKFNKINALIAVGLFSGGYLSGFVGTSSTVEDFGGKQKDLILHQSPALVAHASVQPNIPPAAQVKSPTTVYHPAEKELALYLRAAEVDTRLNGLYAVWRNDVVEKYTQEIMRLAEVDPNTKVRVLAHWILGRQPASENPVDTEAHAYIVNSENPDEQIKNTLYENPEKITQNSEVLNDEPDLLEPIFQLTEDQQLIYIKQLVESQEDAAVVALSDLIINDNPSTQNAAIEGLFSLLENRTGHAVVVAENLTQNAVFLTDLQREKLQQLLQSSTSP